MRGNKIDDHVAKSFMSKPTEFAGSSGRRVRGPGLPVSGHLLSNSGGGRVEKALVGGYVESPREGVNGERPPTPRHKRDGIRVPRS